MHCYINCWKSAHTFHPAARIYRNGNFMETEGATSRRFGETLFESQSHLWWKLSPDQNKCWFQVPKEGKRNLKLWVDSYLQIDRPWAHQYIGSALCFVLPLQILNILKAFDWWIECNRSQSLISERDCPPSAIVRVFDGENASIWDSESVFGEMWVGERRRDDDLLFPRTKVAESTSCFSNLASQVHTPPRHLEQTLPHIWRFRNSIIQFIPMHWQKPWPEIQI